MIANETVRVSYAGNNSTSTPYPIAFDFRNKEDIVVVVRNSAGVETTLEVDVGFTVSGAGLTTTAAVAATSTVVIYRRSPATQSSDYVTLSAFPAESHEDALDKLTLLAQEARDGLERCFRLSDSATAIPPGAATIITDSVLGLDPSGLPEYRTATEVMAWLSLASTVFNFPTKTWSNNAERTLAVPDFIGQLGMQRDTRTTYMGSALSAGSWTATTAAGVADLSITTDKLANEALAANTSGRAKMMDAFITLAKLNTDIFSSATADTLLDHTDELFGYNGTEFRKYAGNVVVPPGTVIQTQYAEYTANTNITAVLPSDDTFPQITEGTEILSLSITPRFATSKILLKFDGTISASAIIGVGAAFFRVPLSNAIRSCEVVIPAGVYREQMAMSALDAPATASAITYTVRVGPGTAGTIRMNGAHTQRMHGGAQACTLVAQEIKV